MAKLRKTWPGRFWEKVQQTDACWIWTASRDTSGYGQIRVDGRLRRATHIAWELTYGAPPTDDLLCHTCDTPACVNPAHLFPGDHQVNAADMVQKGRSATGDRSSSRRYREPRQGERHARAKLHDSDVYEIRRRSAAGESQRQLARAYGVAKNTIQRIVEGKGWAHLIPH